MIRFTLVHTMNNFKYLAENIAILVFQNVHYALVFSFMKVDESRQAPSILCNWLYISSTRKEKKYFLCFSEIWLFTVTVSCACSSGFDVLPIDHYHKCESTLTSHLQLKDTPISSLTQQTCIVYLCAPVCIRTCSQFITNVATFSPCHHCLYKHLSIFNNWGSRSTLWPSDSVKVTQVVTAGISIWTQHVILCSV